MDVTAAVTAINGVETSIYAVGSAIWILAAAALGVAWIKAAFF